MDPNIGQVAMLRIMDMPLFKIYLNLKLLTPMINYFLNWGWNWVGMQRY